MNKPIFKPVFGDTWVLLPKVFLRHYQISCDSNERVVAKGLMDIKTHGLLKLFKPIYRLLKMAPIISCKQVPCEVIYSSKAKTNYILLTRSFHFPNKKSYSFQSKMLPLYENVVLDIMHFGFCWKLKYYYEQNKIKLEHLGYGLKLCKYIIPLPITFILGKIEAYEYVIDEQKFGMYAHIKHPWFGILYSYQGEFCFQ